MLCDAWALPGSVMSQDRQLLVVIHAVDSLVLPAARDLCTEYQLNAENTMTAKFWRLFQRCMLVSFEDQLDDRTGSDGPGARGKTFGTSGGSAL